MPRPLNDVSLLIACTNSFSMRSTIFTLRAPEPKDAATTRGMTLPNAQDVMSTSWPCSVILCSSVAMQETSRSYWNSRIAEITGWMSTSRISHISE